MRAAIALALVAGLFVSAEAKPKKTKKHDPTAFVIVLDRSGSMQGLKLETAKDAVLSAVEALGAKDTFALVTFDSEAQLVVAPKKPSQRKAIEKEVKAIEAGGGTNIFPGLQQARAALADIKGVKKHVLVFTDGEAPYDGIIELATEMHEKDGITISTVGVAGADRNLLSQISDAAGGRMYLVDEIDVLTRVFIKEALIAKE